MNTAKCPKCDELVSNVHYEAHSPSLISGYRGSQSFTAVAHPCGHVLGAVPITWEMRLEELDRTNKELTKKLDSLHKELLVMLDIVKRIDSRIK